MSNWEYFPSITGNEHHYIYEADGEMTSGKWIGEACDEETARQIIREHNTHEELVAMATLFLGEYE